MQENASAHDLVTSFGLLPEANGKKFIWFKLETLQADLRIGKEKFLLMQEPRERYHAFGSGSKILR